MDFLVFYSQFSPSSKKLFENFPNLLEKAVCVDSSAMRVYVKKIHIVCVPTLLVILGDRVIDRVVGYDSINNWLLTSIYRMNQLQTQISEPDYTSSRIESALPNEYPKESSYIETPTEDVTTSSEGATTQLDDLILEDIPLSEQQQDRETPLVQTGMSANTLMLAEALKKERDSFDPSANKKKFTQ